MQPVEKSEPVDVALANLAKVLTDTATAHEGATKAVSIAQSAEVSRRNDMNKAQREFDAFVAKLKSNAPRGSDWERALKAPGIAT